MGTNIRENVINMEKTHFKGEFPGIFNVWAKNVQIVTTRQLDRVVLLSSERMHWGINQNLITTPLSNKRIDREINQDPT